MNVWKILGLATLMIIKYGIKNDLIHSKILHMGKYNTKPLIFNKFDKDDKLKYKYTLLQQEQYNSLTHVQ